MWLVTAFAEDTWARIAADAPLYARPGDAEPVTTLPGRDDYLFAVVAQRAGWVELRNTRPEARPCAAGQLMPDDAVVTWWTPAASLLQVATRAVHAQPEPGVTLDVWPGWVAGSDPFDAWVRSKLPKKVFGTTFVIPADATANAKGVFVHEWDGQLRIDGEVLQLHPWRVDSADLDAPVKFWVDGRCLAVVAPTVTDVPLPMLSMAGIGGGGLADGTFGVLGLRSGAVLRWPDGAEAGRVADELLLFDPRAVDGLTCGTWQLWGQAPAGARLCVSTADLGRVAFGTIDPDAPVVWSAPGGYSTVPRSVLADALVAVEPAVAACLRGVASSSVFDVRFSVEGGAVASVTVTPSFSGRPVPDCLAPALQMLALPPSSSGQPQVSLRWSGG